MTGRVRLSFSLRRYEFAADVQGHGVVQESVEDRGGDDPIAEHITPGAEALIAGQDHPARGR